MIETGRALFNTPQLLGGQAARAEVSCASCHSNGRRAEHFRLDGISAAPGTADVSSGFFSVARDDRRFDPKPIPDLAVPGKVSRTDRGALEAFLNTLVTKEFDGHPPAPTTLAALAAYVRSIRACSGPTDQSHRMAREIGLVEAAVRGAATMAANGESGTAAVLVAGARHQLGLIDERLVDGDRNAQRERAALLRESRLLEPGAAPISPDRLRRWLARFDQRLVPRLLLLEPHSLYEPEVLDRWLALHRS